MHELIGKKVEIMANDISYHGTLVEIGLTEVHLQADDGWIVIPMDAIVEIKALSA